MSTYASLHYHIVYSTKDRIALIADTWADRLHEYLGGIVKSLGGFPQSIGGTDDHVHLLVGLRTTYCIADVTVENATLELFEGLGYQILHGPHIAPGEPAAERGGFDQVVLESRLQEAILRLNSSVAPKPAKMRCGLFWERIRHH